jgi:hypothetical protein
MTLSFSDQVVGLYLVRTDVWLGYISLIGFGFVSIMFECLDFVVSGCVCIALQLVLIIFGFIIGLPWYVCLSWLFWFV